MSDRMLVDIGIVFYNRPEFTPLVLDRLLRSQAESKNHVRLFVADNSSDPAARRLIVDSMHLFDRTTFYKTNVGLVAALNDMGSMMDAEYIAFMDADTLVPPDIWDKIFEPLIHLPKVGSVSPKWLDPVEDSTRKAFSPDSITDTCHGFRIGTAPNTAVVHAMRRKDFETLGGYKDDIGSNAGVGCESDFCRRVRNDLGMDVVFHHDIMAIHLPNTIGESPEYGRIKAAAKARDKAIYKEFLVVQET